MITSRKIAIVTGGCGFIGSHMVDLLLSKDFCVRVIDSLVGGRLQNLSHHKGNKNLAIEEMDIRDVKKDSPIFTNTDYVFHFAGIGDIVPSIEAPLEYMDTNVQGTVCVLEAARTAGVKKFVYAASSSCYGLAATPTREDHPISTKYPYALSKYMGEQACMHWQQVYKLPVISIRIFNAYGTRSRTSGAYGAVFGTFLRQKLAGRPFTVVGNGNQSRDFLYVTDVANAFYLAAESNFEGRVYNLGANLPQSVNKLVALLGGDVTYIPKRPGEPECTWADTSKIHAELDWYPLVSFEEGVQKILGEIQYWKDAPLWDPISIEHATRAWFSFMGDKQ